MAISNIIILGGYPSPAQPTQTPFVRQFAHALARQGLRCTVISPVAWHRGWQRKGFPFRSTDQGRGGNSVEVFRPLFFSFSARASFAKWGCLNPSLITLSSYTAAVRSIVRRHSLQPDVLYGHFLYLAGAAAAQVGRELGIPAFPGMGESVAPGQTIWSLAKYSQEKAVADFSDISGLIVNSDLLKRMVLEQLAIPENRIGVFPNGIDSAIFYPRDRAAMRKKHNLPQEIFLVACAGHYSHRKGQKRVLEALSSLEGTAGVFIGGGVPEQVKAQVVLNRRIPHEQVPELLSACDVFALPTLGEGCCNSIIEAMSCGLPIISSIGEFNDALLTEEMSIRVDPLNVTMIRQAIEKFRSDPSLCRHASVASLKQALKFDINDRACRIIHFMEEHRPNTKVR